MSNKNVKINEARRNLKTLEVVDWSDLVKTDHPARRLMSVIDKFDLTELYASVNSFKHQAGRSALDPKILLGIHIYAAMKGISSSRLIADHCKWEPGFRWILGHGLSVEHVSISTFRKNAGKFLDTVLTQIVTAMITSGLVNIDQVILDGTKIKANAGRGSFRTQSQLLELQTEISTKLKNLSEQEHYKNQKAKIDDQQERVQKALDQIPDIQKALNEAALKKKKGTPIKDPKSSSTDPDARQMRFADKSNAPGYNVQFMTAPKSGVIIDLEVTQRRNDKNLLTPMIGSFKKRYKKLPKQILGDTGYNSISDVQIVLEQGVEVYCPLSKVKGKAKEASKKKLERRRSKEPEIIKIWRAEMATDEAKNIRKNRSQTEKVHGWVKSKMQHGQLNLRGISGAKTEILLFAIGYNMLRYIKMMAA